MAANCRFAFGVHLLSVLALFPDENVSSEKLAFTINTNAVVIRRMLLDLKTAGLIETHRGPGGGTRLKKSAKLITLAEIHHAVAGEIQTFGSHPNSPAQECFVGREIGGVLQEISRNAAAAVEREFAAVTLADIAQKIGDRENLRDKLAIETQNPRT